MPGTCDGRYGVRSPRVPPFVNGAPAMSQDARGSFVIRTIFSSGMVAALPSPTFVYAEIASDVTDESGTEQFKAIIALHATGGIGRSAP